MRSASLQTSAGTAFRCCPSTFGSILPCSVRVRPKMKIAGEEAKEIQILRTCYYSFARPLRTAGRCSLKNPRAWSASLNQVVKRTALPSTGFDRRASGYSFFFLKKMEGQGAGRAASAQLHRSSSVFFFLLQTDMNECLLMFIPPFIDDVAVPSFSVFCARIFSPDMLFSRLPPDICFFCDLWKF